MHRWKTSRIRDFSHGLFRIMMTIMLCALLVGCQSIRLGIIFTEAADESLRVPRATFGPPGEVSEAVSLERSIVAGRTAENRTCRITLQVPVATLKAASHLQQKPSDDQSPPPPDNDPTTREYLIDLDSAMRLAGVENPTIAQAEEVVRTRLAELKQARALLLPTLNAGMNMRVHRGALQNGQGTIIESGTQSLYYGFGADVKGGGTVAVPGIQFVSHLSDALFAPQAAQGKVFQSRFTEFATRNAILGEVGIRYLTLVAEHARLDALRQSRQEIAEVERITANFAKTGQGRVSDAERARTEGLLIQAEEQRAFEDIRSAAAEIGRLLDLDPALRLSPVDTAPVLIEFVDARLPLKALLDEATVHHPELNALQAELHYLEIRLRQEHVRPWLPLIIAGMSVGEFGGGSQTSSTHLGNFNARTDLDVVAVWTLQNMGLGNHALGKLIQTDWEIAWMERSRVLERIRREVSEAYSLLNTRRDELSYARTRLELSRRAFQEDMLRIKNLQGRPLEVLSSIHQLSEARLDLIRATTTYSQAQLQLQVALGCDPRINGTQLP